MNHRSEHLRGATWEARAIFALTFPFFVAAGTAARLLPFPRPRMGEGRSVLGEARAAAATCAAFAFLG